LKTPRRVGTKTSKTRATLIDVTEEIMLEHGYAAVSSRQVAARAGVKAPLVHYYFPTLDDLFVAVFRQRAELSIQRLEQALDSDRPLRAMWDFNKDKTGARITMEFLALANHRKAIRSELAAIVERIRVLQLEAMKKTLAGNAIDEGAFPPLAMVVLMSSLPRIAVLEQAMGISMGHAEAMGFVEGWLERLEGPAPKARSRAPRKKAARSKTPAGK